MYTNNNVLQKHAVSIFKVQRLLQVWHRVKLGCYLWKQSKATAYSSTPSFHLQNMKINIWFKFSGHHRDIIEDLCFSVKWCVTGCFQTFQRKAFPSSSSEMQGTTYTALQHHTPTNKWNPLYMVIISIASWTLSQPQGLFCILVLFFWYGKLYVSIQCV